MDRQVKQVDPKPKDGEEALFSSFKGAKNIVVLGDPGAGKSELFRFQARATDGAFFTVRELLNTPLGDIPSNQVLWIDALDETQGGRGDRSPVDELTRKLAEISPCGVRLSCRAADWLHTTDLEALKPYLRKGGETFVVQLLALSRTEQAQILRARGFDDAERFLEQAERRELGELLGNAQTLLMLAAVSGRGDWPASRTELFQRAALGLLDEVNPQHADRDQGCAHIPGRQLLDAAGALCALRLTSNCSGFTWKARSVGKDVPSYKDVTLASQDHLLACLKRRVFVASGVDRVDYVHRTVAEYLAARWIADRVQSGLPIGRVLALMGIQERPPTALRGLLAWLTSLVPDSSSLLHLDLSGLLMYGDLSAWTSPMKQRLLNALIEQSETNPRFFREKHLPSGAYALADQTLLGTYQELLQSPGAEVSVKLLAIVVQKAGRIMPGIEAALQRLILDPTQVILLRMEAIQALLDGGVAHRQMLVDCYRQLGTGADELRLRLLLLRALYGDGLDKGEIGLILKAIVNPNNHIPPGASWGLTDFVTPTDAAGILLSLDLPLPSSPLRVQRNSWEFAHIYGELLVKALAVQDVNRSIFDWYQIYQHHLGGQSPRRGVLNALSVGDGRDRALLRGVLQRIDLSGAFSRSWDRFMRLFGSALNPQIVLNEMEFALRASCDERRSEVYGACLRQAIRDDVSPYPIFWRLYALAEEDPELNQIRSVYLVGYLDDTPVVDFEKLHKQEREAEDEQWVRELAAEFSAKSEEVVAGKPFHLLDSLAGVYFGQWLRISHAATLTPHARLQQVLGEDGASTTLRGFSTLLTTGELPGIGELLSKRVGQTEVRWTALLAALDDHWCRTARIADLPDAVWSAGLAVALICPVYIEMDSHARILDHVWFGPLLEAKPKLAIQTYEAILAAELALGGHQLRALRSLEAVQLAGLDRGKAIVRVLQAHPRVSESDLLRMLRLCKAEGCWSDLRALARIQVDQLLSEQDNDTEHLRGGLRGGLAAWLWCGFSLSPEAYFDVLQGLSGEREESVMWVLLEDGAEASWGSQKTWSYSLPQIEFIVTWVASRYPYMSHPTGSSVGTRNPWDAASMVNTMLAQLGSDPGRAAGEALARLAALPGLGSYRANILHQLASHKTVLADTRYETPSWEQAMKTLENGAPSNAQDLHEFVFSHLEHIAQSLSTRNDDPYKQFWNTGSSGHIETPKVEEIARNCLLGMLRPLLIPHGLRAEPEGHMSAGKRVDIVVYGDQIKSVIEIKRDFHSQVWTAASEQLHRLYSIDPEAGDFGIYLVFWYGEKRKADQPLPPNRKVRPATAKEMQVMLEADLPAHLRASTRIVVMDVTGARDDA
ncbi:NACHT domain-containing protein [Stenotrophomonas rhizophila]|uniref:NACHT domain-containing protein n=1 Tax=Stenotrophomonas rhizophila TaxID=216778 RepID=UPI003396A21D